ncbi:MAG: adenylyl-sulfate kinase [Polyangiaceae bacterium]
METKLSTKTDTFSTPKTVSEAGAVLWLTGLSGAGKSTLADALVPRLRAAGKKVEVLDGDVVRTHLSKGLGFSREDRDLNVARIAFVAGLLARNGVVVLVAAVSPFRSARDDARNAIVTAGAKFMEIHVAPPLAECIKRDVKGLYKKAIAGEIAQFTGVSDPYEEPLTPEVKVDTSIISVDEGVQHIEAHLRTLLDATKPIAISRTQ